MLSMLSAPDEGGSLALEKGLGLVREDVLEGQGQGK